MNTHRKSLLSIAVYLILLLALLNGCGSKSESSDSDNPPPPDVDLTKFNFVIHPNDRVASLVASPEKITNGYNEEQIREFTAVLYKSRSRDIHSRRTGSHNQARNN